MIKLGLELVPESAYYSNLRSKMPPSEWTALSRSIRDEHNRTCQYCGAVENPARKEWTHCHEVWVFDEEKGTQTLTGFECLCERCHMIHHWVFATEIKRMDPEELIEHACQVNGCMPGEFREHIEEAKQTYHERSQMKWKLKLGKWEYLTR